LYVIPASGGREQRIASFGYYPHWSPDGTRILFLGFPLRTAGEAKKAYVVTLDGEVPHEVQSEFLSEFIYFGVRGVAWHPDAIEFRSGEITANLAWVFGPCHSMVELASGQRYRLRSRLS
jgi:hypothetical protein